MVTGEADEIKRAWQMLNAKWENENKERFYSDYTAKITEKAIHLNNTCKLFNHKLYEYNKELLILEQELLK